MAKLPIDLANFKKIKADKQTTTLRHPKGHQITLAHSALSPAMRGQLAALPMAEGGEVSDPTQRHLLPGDKIPNAIQKHEVAQARKKLAKGGKVQEAENDEIDDQKEQEDRELIDEVKDEDLRRDLIKKSQKMADGGDVTDSGGDSADNQDQQPAPQQAPVVVNINGANSPQLPESLVNPEAGKQGAQALAKANPPVTQSAPGLASPENLPYGITPENMMSKAPEAAMAPLQASPENPMNTAQAAPQQATQDPYGTGATADIFGQGLAQQQAGIKGQMGAEQALGAQQAKYLSQSIQNQRQINQIFQNHYAALQNEYEGFVKDVRDQHIDPNHYLSSKDVPQKIATAIGLILGGIGGGMTHQENPALKFLQAQINNDIEAQRANLGKSQNLLSANLRQFGNMRDAIDMTRMMQNGIVMQQMQLAAAKATDPQAKARMLQALGQFNMQNAATVGQMAMRKTLLSGMQSGQISPDRVVEALVPEHDKNQVYKELEEANKVQKAKDQVLSAFDRIAELQSAASRIGSPIQSKSRIEALSEPLIAGLSKQTAGRYTDSDARAIGAGFPLFKDDAETIALKRNEIIKMLNKDMNFSRLRYYGIDPTKRAPIKESAPIGK